MSLVSPACRQVLAWSAMLAVVIGVGAPAPASIAQTRQRVFISDLHFGVGRDAAGAWRNFEDFRWAEEFAGFLADVDRRGDGTTDLIIVGDGFELWQSTIGDCAYATKDWGCTEEDALGRLNRVIANHGAELKAIGDFASRGSNRVIIIPGNHDAALLFPSVAARAIEATGAPNRVSVSASGVWTSEDGAIVAEHGHQIGKEVNRFEGWPRPFLASPPHLRRPWGEQFVQDYYNAFEEKYPIIDNILSEGVGVYYAAKAEGAYGTAEGVGRFAAFLLTKLSWAQFGGFLGPSPDHPESVWDLEAVRNQRGQFLIDSFPVGDPMRSAMEQAAKAQPGGLSLADFSDEEIREICEARASLNAVDPQVRLVANPPLCPVTKLGALSQTTLRRSRNKILVEHLKGLQTQPKPRALQLFIYGHTHTAEDKFTPFERAFDDWQPRVINTGAWQRVVHPEVLEEWRGTSRSHAQALALQPAALPACYSFVVVPPYADTPNAQLEFWTELGGKWQAAASCSATIR